MGKFFVDPYLKYYEKLKGASNIATEASSIASSVSTISGIVSSLSSMISNSGWKELGIEVLANSTIPGIISNVGIFHNNIDGVLKVAASQAINSLYPEAEKLKTEDEKYETTTTSLNNLVVPVQNDDEGHETAAYGEYLKEKARLEKEQKDLEESCKKLQQSCDTIASAIKALDGSIVDLKEVSFTDNSGDTTITRIDGIGNGTMYKISYAGREFYVANTKLDLFEYEAYLQKYNIRQNAGFKDSECDSLSKQIAVDLMRGTMTRKANYASSSSAPATRIKNKVLSQDPDDILKYVYEEVSNGRPVVIQVTQKRSNEGLRHFVTVVGFDSSVQSYKDLTPDNILVLDCVDAKVQTLSGKERTDGKGHNRQLYNQGGNGFYALGATQAFLAKEVFKNA